MCDLSRAARLVSGYRAKCDFAIRRLEGRSEQPEVPYIAEVHRERGAFQRSDGCDLKLPSVEVVPEDPCGTILHVGQGASNHALG